MNLLGDLNNWWIFVLLDTSFSPVEANPFFRGTLSHRCQEPCTVSSSRRKVPGMSSPKKCQSLSTVSIMLYWCWRELERIELIIFCWLLDISLIVTVFSDRGLIFFKEMSAALMSTTLLLVLVLEELLLTCNKLLRWHS